MIGFGPKRNAQGLRQREPVPEPDELDDIFAPEPVQHPNNAQGPHPRAQTENGGPPNPSNVRTRLILRRALIRQARAERISRSPATAPAPARASAKPAIQKPAIQKKPAPAPARAAKPDRKPVRKSKGLQLGIAAAIAGVICGTALAYVASDYFSGSLSAQNMDAATDRATGGQIEPAAAEVPDVAEARASTQPAAYSDEEEARPADDVEGSELRRTSPRFHRRHRRTKRQLTKRTRLRRNRRRRQLPSLRRPRTRRALSAPMSLRRSRLSTRPRKQDPRGTPSCRARSRPSATVISVLSW